MAARDEGNYSAVFSLAPIDQVSAFIIVLEHQIHSSQVSTENDNSSSMSTSEVELGTLTSRPPR
jgi:hypothetical protein